MMRLRKRTIILVLLVSFAIGFFTSFLTFPKKSVSHLDSKSSISPKQLQKQAANVDASYQKQIETLTEQNLELQQELEVSQGLLSQAKQEVKEKEANLKKLIEQAKVFKTKNSLQRDLIPLNEQKLIQKTELALFASDENQYNPCDSLAEEVTSYIDANHRKDSVYESQIVLFDSVITAKGLLIESSGKAYDDLHLLFDKAVTEQALLQKENNFLTKQNKRHRFKSKLLTGGLMILSGFTANFLIRR